MVEAGIEAKLVGRVAAFVGAAAAYRRAQARRRRQIINGEAVDAHYKSRGYVARIAHPGGEVLVPILSAVSMGIRHLLEPVSLSRVWACDRSGRRSSRFAAQNGRGSVCGFTGSELVKLL